MLRTLVAFLFFLLPAAGCFHGELTRKVNEPETTATVEGHFCTSDPESIDYPVKILLIIDNSGSMRYFDEDGERFQAARDLVSTYSSDENYSFGLVVYNSTTTVTTPLDDPFVSDETTFEAHLEEVEEAKTGTPYLEALDIGYQLIVTDMALHPKTAPNTTYVTFLLSDGLPTDQCESDKSPELCFQKVEQFVELASMDEGCLSSTLHTGYLQVPGEFKPIDFLTALAELGNGTFVLFDGPTEIDFHHIDLTGLRRTHQQWSFIANNLNTRPTENGIEVDSDGDGLSDVAEKSLGSDLTRGDSDEDGCSDFTEHVLGWPLHTAPDAESPNHCTCAMEGLVNPFGDGDGDGLNDCEETFLKGDRENPDTDLDGIPDGLEVHFGTYLDIPDDSRDPDLDEDDNITEIRKHRSPNISDDEQTRAFSYLYDIEWESTTPTGQKCYAFSVENIEVLPTIDGQPNQIELVWSETPSDRPGKALKYYRWSGEVNVSANGELNPATLTVNPDDFQPMVREE